MHKINKLLFKLSPRGAHRIEVFGSLVLCLLVFTSPVGAVTRFQERSLRVDSNEPGATTNYEVSFRFDTLVPVGSIGMRFCIDPIPYMPCEPPEGLDVSQAVLSEQAGETGFSMVNISDHELLLTRPSAQVVTDQMNTYVLGNIVNPTYTDHSYSIRLTNFASTDGSGATIDVGSVLTTMASAVQIETQVPPQLVFCLGQQVSLDCTNTSGGNFSDMGVINDGDTLTAQSQMALGTNASSGFVVTVNGGSMTAGTRAIEAPLSPADSRPGTNQFGLNLVANFSPGVGRDPDGESTNANPTADYARPNKFLFRDGDVVASSPNVSLVRRFTVSYILNSSPNLPAGVYNTTLTFIATGRF